MDSTATSVTHCLECNAALSLVETQGLCARCLLKIGLASQFGEGSVADAGTRKVVPPPLFRSTSAAIACCVCSGASALARSMKPSSTSPVGALR